MNNTPPKQPKSNQEATMTTSKVATLLTAPWLKQQILPAAQKLPSNIRVLDSVWELEPDVDSYKLYQQEHIPTSLHFNINEITASSKGRSQHVLPVPEAKVFKQYVEHLGISNDTHVVVYDNSMFKPAFRTWFLFRLFGHDKVSVLNGGLDQWKHQGYPVTTVEPKVEKAVFEPNFRPHLLRDFGTMKKNLESKKEQVVDSRPLETIEGCIPGSALLSITTLSKEDGTFKEGQELKDVFDKANLDLHKPMVVSCEIAMSACAVVAAAHSLGKEDVPIYNGSFTEWSQMAGPGDIARL